MSTIIFKFFWIFWKFRLKGQFFSPFRWVRYAGHISNVVSAREGDLRVPKPERPPSRSHPVGHGTSVTSSMCNGLTSVCMLRCWMWYVVPIWFSYSSVLDVMCCADLVLVFFAIYIETFSRYSSIFIIYRTGRKRPFPSPTRVLCFSCRLEVSA